MVFLFMTLRLSFRALYSLTYMSLFNTLPSPSLYESLPNTFHPISEPQTPLVTSSFHHPLPIGGS